MEALGLEVAVRAFTPQTVSADVGAADLLVVNSGRGEHQKSSDGPEPASVEAVEAVEAFEVIRGHRARRRPVLALHAAANTLEGLPEWPRWIGGRWNREYSMHPPDRCLPGGGQRG